MTVCYSSFWLRRYPVSFHSLEFRTLTQKQTNKQRPKALAARKLLGVKAAAVTQ